MNTKKRISPLISTNKVVNMIKLFESKIDEKIELIDVEMNMIQTGMGLYKIDFSKNKVEIINFEKYELIINEEPFDD